MKLFKLRLGLSSSFIIISFVFTTIHAGSYRKNNITESNIVFYIEDTNEVPSNSNFSKIISGKTIYFNKIPLISAQHIEWYYSFKNTSKNSYGVSFKLNKHGTHKLFQASKDLPKHYILPVSKTKYESKDYFPILIDRPVNTGIITIWAGVEKADIRKLKRHFKKYRKKFSFKFNKK